VIHSQDVNATLEEADASCAVIKTDSKTGYALIRRLGGSYKLARVIGNSLTSALEELQLPFKPKFNWTVSAYECKPDLYGEAHRSLQDLLKQKGLGKSKFLRAEIYSSAKRDSDLIKVAEIRAEDINHKILFSSNGNSGIDLVIHGGMNGGKPIFAQTIETFDSIGFDERDFERPYQDPTKTVSPRIARTIVNLALKADSRSLLDPFCGLGTVLQEALLCNVSIIGVDRDQNSVDRAKANLKWLISKYHVSSVLHSNLFAYDAKRISHATMPKVDAIATEPILLPVFKNNPSVSRSEAVIEKAKYVYERCLSEFASILSKKGDRIALTTPVLIDSSGKRRTFNLTEAAADAGFKPYTGCSNLTEDIRYPLPIESAKKRTIQRTLNVFYLS
jgi:tRNA G10  N-methylase Trm11